MTQHTPCPVCEERGFAFCGHSWEPDPKGVQAAPEKLHIEGCCRDCSVKWPIKDGGPVVVLCPLHAQAEAVREALEKLCEAVRIDGHGSVNGHARAAFDDARALLATIQKGG